ncbi:MarR family winged helix-turn-helix transcriptional regulator [Roseivirga sp. BDSF3-8]|uniref:MarR family winged helix-turn-helix transcriptional regulator n=1 Tax=Roseivirga sp. BDSF3-8 TaxID=3241598 RepID=UPI003531F41E
MNIAMGLSEDIHQKEFSGVYQKSLINLIYTSNHIIYKANAFFKKYGLTRQQYNVLRILRGHQSDGASVNVIKNRMLDKMSDASRIVERLRVKGLVERHQDREDRRAVTVTITDKGVNLLQKMDNSVKVLEEDFRKLSTEEADLLNELLDRLRD